MSAENGNIMLNETNHFTSNSSLGAWWGKVTGSTILFLQLQVLAMWPNCLHLLSTFSSCFLILFFLGLPADLSNSGASITKPGSNWGQIDLSPIGVSNTWVSRLEWFNWIVPIHHIFKLQLWICKNYCKCVCKVSQSTATVNNNSPWLILARRGGPTAAPAEKMGEAPAAGRRRGGVGCCEDGRRQRRPLLGGGHS